MAVSAIAALALGQGGNRRRHALLALPPPDRRQRIGPVVADLRSVVQIGVGRPALEIRQRLNTTR